jgi:hypothetical protein
VSTVDTYSRHPLMTIGIYLYAGPLTAETLKRPSEIRHEHRQRASLSQEKLAASARIKRTYVGGAERGERNVPLVNTCAWRRPLVPHRRGLDDGQVCPAALGVGIPLGEPTACGLLRTQITSEGWEGLWTRHVLPKPMLKLLFNLAAISPSPKRLPLIWLVFRISKPSPLSREAEFLRSIFNCFSSPSKDLCSKVLLAINDVAEFNVTVIDEFKDGAKVCLAGCNYVFLWHLPQIRTGHEVVLGAVRTG